MKARFTPMKTDVRKNYQATPSGVQLAVTILWACFGIGLLNTFFVVPHPDPILPGTYAMGFVIFGAEALVIAAIGRGGNWARMLLLIFSLKGFASTILMMHILLRLNGLLPILIVLAENILQVVALLLLFQRDASECFRGDQRAVVTPQYPQYPMRQPYRPYNR
jgi:hypothetical protein